MDQLKEMYGPLVEEQLGAMDWAPVKRDSEDEDSGEVSAGLQVRVSIVPVTDQGLQSSGFIGTREVKCYGPLSDVASSRLRTILNTNNSRFPPALADAKDVFQELPCIMLSVQLGPVP